MAFMITDFRGKTRTILFCFASPTTYLMRAQAKVTVQQPPRATVARGGCCTVTFACALIRYVVGDAKQNNIVRVLPLKSVIINAINASIGGHWTRTVTS